MKTKTQNDELTCKPLDTYTEILNFLQDPPPWRSLCKELTPHSNKKIKNYEINNQHNKPCLENPESFCHFKPDTDEPKRHDEKSLPKTLVCHDMANGYHDDCYVDGTGVYDAYTFYNWAGIDIFCYFSHHLITIPPLGWINIGHAHGVKVIGTVITEWAQGAEFWDKILSSETNYQNFASALVAIAKTLKFDGWLLNVENQISKPQVLINFVRYLHKILHEEIPHAELIWYDSVTVEGKLIWQNALTNKNKDFFDACDGLFTNYSWSEKDIAKSAIMASDRITDVYIGIDVWGRNFYGGGHFNTQEAVKVAYAYGCSLAIFAQAWTHEAIPIDNNDNNGIVTGDNEELDRLHQFILRDRAFWGSLWPFLATRLPCTMPFQTSFCRGQGKKRRICGDVLSPLPWYNLRHQQYQPNSSHGPHGYLLTNVDNKLRMLQHGFLKGADGILRYRDSYLNALPEPSVSGDVIDDATTENEIIEDVKTRKKSSRPERALEAEQPAEVDEGRVGRNQAATPVAGAPGAGAPGAGVPGAPGAARGRVPQRYTLAYIGRERECLELHEEDAFTGGACLRVHPCDEVSDEHRLTRLLHCDFRCERELVVCVVTKKLAGCERQELDLHLCMVRDSGLAVRVLLAGWRGAAPAGDATLYPLDKDSEQFCSLQRYLLLNKDGFYVPVENSFNWNVKYYEVKVPGSRVTSVNCKTELATGSILLGHLGICPRTSEHEI